MPPAPPTSRLPSPPPRLTITPPPVSPTPSTDRFSHPARAIPIPRVAPYAFEDDDDDDEMSVSVEMANKLLSATSVFPAAAQPAKLVATATTATTSSPAPVAVGVGKSIWTVRPSVGDIWGGWGDAGWVGAGGRAGLREETARVGGWGESFAASSRAPKQSKDLPKSPMVGGLSAKAPVFEYNPRPSPVPKSRIPVLVPATQAPRKGHGRSRSDFLHDVDPSPLRPNPTQPSPSFSEIAAFPTAPATTAAHPAHPVEPPRRSVTPQPFRRPSTTAIRVPRAVGGGGGGVALPSLQELTRRLRESGRIGEARGKRYSLESDASAESAQYAGLFGSEDSTSESESLASGSAEEVVTPSRPSRLPPFLRNAAAAAPRARSNSGSESSASGSPTKPSFPAAPAVRLHPPQPPAALPTITCTPATASGTTIVPASMAPRSPEDREADLRGVGGLGFVPGEARPGRGVAAQAGERAREERGKEMMRRLKRRSGGEWVGV